MNHLSKMILAFALVACTVLTTSCVGGDENAEVKKTPFPASTNGEKTNPSSMTPGEEPTPGGSTMNPAISEIPSDAEKWINACENAESVLMSYEQIQKMNAEIRSRCAALTDIESYPTYMSKSALTSLIENSSGPSIPKYDENGKEITLSDWNDIRDNRNLGALEDTNSFTKGVTVQRTDIRALPTAREFYDKASIQDHDRMQESELAAGSAVWILHTSKDGKFYFIQSYYYAGWVDAENVANAEENSDWNAYAKLLNMTENASREMKFAVVTDSLITVEGVKLDMGTALLLADEQSGGDTYNIILPGKDAEGKLSRIEAEISVKSASVGYLDYTFRNFYVQAFKYAGTPYGWGGMKDHVDCSSYALSVFKTFGFIFPRNTSQQNKAVGNITNVEGKADSVKFSTLENAKVPVLIYKSGHVMIYLGQIENVHYIIHAPGGGNGREDAYDGFSSLIRICEVGPLK